MHPRLVLTSVVYFFCQAALPGQSNSYPFSVDSEKTANGHRIVAINAGPAPVSVKVSIIDSMSIATDRQFPIYAVVPPHGGTLHLGNIRSAMPGVGYTFKTQYAWTLGDFNASQSPGAMYRLPYQDGITFRIGQSPGGPITTHRSLDNQFAVDIPMPEGTPVLAARDGTVIYTEADHVYGAQVPEMLSKANEIRIQHVDGTTAAYVHLAHGGVYVYSGQSVRAGQQIGLAGSTGYSSGSHLHFAVQTVRRNGDKLETVSLPFKFYVGNPPVAFEPQFGMLAKADYSAPGVVPGMAPPQVSRAPQPLQSQPATGNPELVLSFQIPAEIRSYLLRIQSWKWFAGLVALVLLFVWIDKTRSIRRQRELRIIREPSIRS